MERLYVIKIMNTDEAELRKWYRQRGGELHIVRWKFTDKCFETVGYIDNEFGTGYIEHHFCDTIAEFEYDSDKVY